MKFNNYFEAKKAIQEITNRTELLAYIKNMMLTIKNLDETARMRGLETEAIDDLTNMLNDHCEKNNIDQSLIAA